MSRTRILATVLPLLAVSFGAWTPVAGATPATGLPHNPAGGIFARAASKQSKPDDLTVLDNHLYTNYQNGVGPDGAPAGDGTTSSTIAEYDLTGHLTHTWSLRGRCDGLTADPSNHRLIATVNEDSNSYLATITPAAATAAAVALYSYSPSPGDATGQGGTDSIAVDFGHIYIAHSAPVDSTPPAEYEATLSGATATLTPIFSDNSPATDAITGATAPLALTDPDSNTIVPSTVPRFGGQLLQGSQADSQLVFAAGAGSHAPTLTKLDLTYGTATAPTVDDVTFSTADHGTLFVVDQGAGTINALSTDGFPSGTAFVAQPLDSGNPGQIGTIDLATGMITPLDTHFASPKGLLFLPIPPPATTPFGGYLAVDRAGDAASFGVAPPASVPPAHLAAPIVGAAATGSGKGFWRVASDGGVFSSGDAAFLGSAGAVHLNQPIVGMAATPTGKGYWLVAADGGIFNYGDAAFLGSAGAQHLTQPAVGIAVTPAGEGYWIVAADGAVLHFGDAGQFGSEASAALAAPIVGLAPTPSGDGYWLIGSDGGVFTFGDAPFLGSWAGKAPEPVVAIVG